MTRQVLLGLAVLPLLFGAGVVGAGADSDQDADDRMTALSAPAEAMVRAMAEGLDWAGLAKLSAAKQGG